MPKIILFIMLVVSILAATGFMLDFMYVEGEKQDYVIKCQNLKGYAVFRYAALFKFSIINDGMCLDPHSIANFDVGK